MEGGSGVTRSIIDELHSSDIQGDQMLGESGVSHRVIDELHSSNIEGYQMEGESGVTGNIIDHWRTSFLRYPSRSNGSGKCCYWKFHG